MMIVPRQVLIEADNQESLDKARIAVMALIMPPDPTALALYDEAQLVTAALQKTTKTEECAFCGKTGHAHAQCPKRKTKFTMAGACAPANLWCTVSLVRVYGAAPTVASSGWCSYWSIIHTMLRMSRSRQAPPPHRRGALLGVRQHGAHRP